MKLEIQEQLKGNKTKEGQVVHYKVSEDVLNPKKAVVIAKGAEAEGRVVYRKGAKGFGKSSELEISADWVRAVDGTKIPLVFRFKKQARNKGLNRINGFLNPFGKGGDAKIKKGTIFTAAAGVAPPEPVVTDAGKDPVSKKTERRTPSSNCT